MYQGCTILLSAHHVSVFVYVAGLLGCSQQWHKAGQQPVLLQLQYSQLLVSFDFITVNFVQQHLLMVHSCQDVTQVSQALPNIRAATWYTKSQVIVRNEYFKELMSKDSLCV